MHAYKTVVWWQDRIISQKTLYAKKSISLGNHKCDVILPAFQAWQKNWLVRASDFNSLNSKVLERSRANALVSMRV